MIPFRLSLTILLREGSTSNKKVNYTIDLDPKACLNVFHLTNYMGKEIRHISRSDLSRGSVLSDSAVKEFNLLVDIHSNSNLPNFEITEGIDTLREAL